MPCDIGYKSYERAVIPTPVPKKLKSKSEAPKIDADLLAKIGESDPQFLEWLMELNIVPLLESALKKALSKVGSSKEISFSIDKNGNLIAEAEYESGNKKNELTKTIEKISNRWQIETLKIVLELLDYKAVISEEKNSLMVEAEKMDGSPVHKYVRITKNSDGDSNIMFEHFGSPEELKKEKDKFLGLAQKLGVNVEILEHRESGHPIEAHHVHKHFLKEE